MTHHDPSVPALLGSRICHDLISPLGAISNGVELMRMSGVKPGPELDLIAESIENANARIRFFRVAFGAASGDQSIAANEARSILGDLHRGGRLTVDWRLDTDVPRPELKLVFLLLMCLEHAMPRGGQIAVSRGGGGRWQIHGRGERMQADPALWAILSGRGDTRMPAASEVQFALAPDLAASLDRALDVAIGDTAITVGV